MVLSVAAGSSDPHPAYNQSSFSPPHRAQPRSYSGSILSFNFTYSVSLHNTDSLILAESGPIAITAKDGYLRLPAMQDYRVDPSDSELRVVLNIIRQAGSRGQGLSRP